MTTAQSEKLGRTGELIADSWLGWTLRVGVAIATRGIRAVGRPQGNTGHDGQPDDDGKYGGLPAHGPDSYA